MDIQDDERKILRHLRMCASKRGIALHPNYLGSLNFSSSPSTDEENEVEIKGLFNQSYRKPNCYHHSLNQNHFPSPPIEVEEVQAGEIEERFVVVFLNFFEYAVLLGTSGDWFLVQLLLMFIRSSELYFWFIFLK